MEDEEDIRIWKDSIANLIYTLDSDIDIDNDKIIIDGNFVTGEDNEPNLDFFDNLYRVKKLPEAVFFLNCKSETVIKRLVNEEELKEE